MKITILIYSIKPVKDITFIQCIKWYFRTGNVLNMIILQIKGRYSPKSLIFKFSLTKSQLPFINFTGCKYKENTEEHTATGFRGTDGD